MIICWTIKINYRTISSLKTHHSFISHITSLEPDWVVQWLVKSSVDRDYVLSWLVIEHTVAVEEKSPDHYSIEVVASILQFIPSYNYSLTFFFNLIKITSFTSFHLMIHHGVVEIPIRVTCEWLYLITFAVQMKMTLRDYDVVIHYYTALRNLIGLKKFITRHLSYH